MARATVAVPVEAVDLLTPAQAAARMATTPATLADWRYHRRGPAFVKRGRFVRYRPADVDAWLRDATVRPAA